MKLGSRRGILAASVTAALAMTALAAAPAADAATTTSRGGTLTVATELDVTSFDPAQAHQGHPVQFFQPEYDSLIRTLPSGKLVQMLATKWSYNSAKTALTMTIRSGVKFTDGTPVNAAAVKLNLDRFRTGNGPDAATLSDVSNVTAPNSTTVVIDLAAPDPALLNYLGDEDGFIASPKAIAGGHIATDPVGSGPYIYDAAKSVPGSKYTFTRNAHYWDPSLQKYNTIVLEPMTTTTATLNALLSGQVDAALLTPQTAAQASGAGMTEHTYEGQWSGLFIFDRAGKTVPALGNVKVRQAINYAIDKKALLQQVNGGLGTVTSQILPPGVPGYTKAQDSTYGYNVKKAKKLMAAAGYAKGFTVAMPTVAGLINPALQAGISQNLSEIGITVNWTNVPVTSFITDIATGKFPMTWFQETQGTAWYTSGVLLNPTAVYNPDHTSVPQVETWIHTIQTGSTAQQSTAANQLYSYVVQQAWFAPFYRPDSVFFTDKKTNVQTSGLWPVPSIYYYSPKK